MGWRVGKQSHRAKSTKSKPKISGWQELGLTAPSKDRREVSMEEIRRQGRLLAGVGIGQAYRAPQETSVRPASKVVSASKPVGAARRRATR
jgi:hypothetical protein